VRGRHGERVEVPRVRRLRDRELEHVVPARADVRVYEAPVVVRVEEVVVPAESLDSEPGDVCVIA
jgi:hypothetical protein